MDRRRLIKAAIYAALAVAFAWSLLAIVVTGPVSVRRPKRIEDKDLPYPITISVERLRQDVDRLCGELAPRDMAHVENLDRVASWIASEFRHAGLSVELQEYDLPGGRYRNVVGFRGGLDGTGPVRVFGAHYDSFTESPGADDNASGVAVLLELVRTLPPAVPRRGQYFVAFSSEEPPNFATDRMGSAVFARELHDGGTEVDLMIALDLVGYFSDEPGSQGFPFPGLGWLYPDHGNFLAVVGDLRSGRWIRRVRSAMGRTTDLPVYSFRGPSRIPGVMWSDHLAFRELGMPGVLLTDTAFLRNPWYHTPNDLPETLDYERMAEVVRGLHAIVLDRDVSD